MPAPGEGNPTPTSDGAPRITERARRERNKNVIPSNRDVLYRFRSRNIPCSPKMFASR
jgi:hypothetical protein